MVCLGESAASAAEIPTHHHTTTVLRPFFRDHPGEPVPEENFWTLWCKGGLTEADTPTIRLGVTPSGLTSSHLHHAPVFTGQMPFLLPNQQCQSTEGKALKVRFQRFQQYRCIFCGVIGQHKAHFVPQIVRPLLEVTFVPATELRKATLPILYDILECQQQKAGSLREVGTFSATERPDGGNFTGKPWSPYKEKPSRTDLSESEATAATASHVEEWWRLN